MTIQRSESISKKGKANADSLASSVTIQRNESYSKEGKANADSLASSMTIQRNESNSSKAKRLHYKVHAGAWGARDVMRCLR
eukprot:scaffold540687_cov17-Prasinocladus_malaysianus.AAC.1